MSIPPTVLLKRQMGMKKNTVKPEVNGKSSAQRKQKAKARAEQRNCQRRDNLWNDILCKIIEDSGEKLKKADGNYNRGLLFVLVRDFVTEMMHMERKLKKIGPELADTFIQKMVDRYGEKQLKRWNKAKVGQELAEKKIFRDVKAEIDLWTSGANDFEKKMSYYPTLKTITALAWESKKPNIMKNIIEPYLKRHEECETAQKDASKPITFPLEENPKGNSSTPLLESIDELEDSSSDEKKQVKRVKRQLYE